jgi:hypothetical protein
MLFFYKYTCSCDLCFSFISTQENHKYTRAWTCNSKWYLFPILRPRKDVPPTPHNVTFPTAVHSPLFPLQSSSHSIRRDVGSDSLHSLVACSCWFLTYYSSVIVKYIYSSETSVDWYVTLRPRFITATILRTLNSSPLVLHYTKSTWEYYPFNRKSLFVHPLKINTLKSDNIINNFWRLSFFVAE